MAAGGARRGLRRARSGRTLDARPMSLGRHFAVEPDVAAALLAAVGDDAALDRLVEEIEEGAPSFAPWRRAAGGTGVVEAAGAGILQPVLF